MSKLKVYKFLGQDEVWPDANLGSDYYLKSEADKVITELKQKINEAQTELELWRDGSIISETHQKELDEKSHSDYKRCLAMARWCEAEAQNCLTQQGALICFPNTDRFQYLQVHFLHFSRWHRRWLKVAEQFKDKEVK